MAGDNGSRAGASGQERALGWGLGVLALCLFVGKLCPTLCLFGDSAELATAAALWGVPHPPGYPLLTALGHSFSFLPFGSLDWRLHLTSALFHALCVVVVFHLVLSLTEWVVSAAFAAALLMFSRSFLLGSLYYETFPLNDLLCALVLLLAHEVASATPPLRTRRLMWLSATLGLAGAHHHLAVLFVPGALLLAWPPLRAVWREGGWWRVGLAGIVPFVVSLALLFFAAARDTAYSWGRIDDLGSLWVHFSRQDYGGLLSPSAHDRPWLPLERQTTLGVLLAGSLGIPALLTAGFGAVQSIRRQPRVGVAFALSAMLAGPAFFALNRVATGREEYLAWVERFTTLVHVPLVALAGVGLREFRQALAPHARWAVPAAIAVAVTCLVQPLARLPRVGLSNDQLGWTFAEDLIEPTPNRSAILLTTDRMLTAATHYCLAHARCGERLLVPLRAFQYDRIRRQHPELELPAPNSGLELSSSGLPLIVAALSRQRPVYLAPQLIQRAPSLLETHRVVPGLLLFSAEPKDNGVHRYPNGPGPTAAIVPALDQILGACLSCQAFPLDPDRPTMHAETVAFYRTGLINLARFNDFQGGDPTVTRDLLTLERSIRLPAWNAPVELTDEFSKLQL